MPISSVVSPIVPTVDRPIPIGFQGAYAEEIAESRIGLQTGMLGAQNVTRIWRVYTTLKTDNPVATMETLSAKLGGVKVGSVFPKSGGWGDGSFVLQYFTILDHWMGTRVWTIQGNYVPSYIASLPTTLWSFNIQSSLETQKVFTDRNGKGIGAPRYIAVNPTTVTPDFTATSLDPRNPTVYLALAGGGTDPTVLNLPRFMVGADAPKRSSAISFTKTIDSFLHRYQAVQSALNAKRNINNDDVIVATTSGSISFVSGDNGLGTMLLQDVILAEIPNPGGGITPSFRVTINLKYDPDRWQHHLTHTHKFDDGTEAPIIQVATGELVDEEFIINGETSISGILGAFV